MKVVRAREPASFWRENVVVEVAETRYQMLEVLISFCYQERVY